MSAGNGDDDIEDELRRLTGEISELTRLLERALRQGAEGPEEADERPTGDLWNIGETSPGVGSIGEYKDLRSEAATSTDLVAPYFEPGVFDTNDEKIEARYELFKEGYDSMESLWASLGEESFSALVRLFAKDFLGAEEEFAQPIAADLIDMLEPGYGFFGLRVVGDNLSATERLTSLDFLICWGDLYYPRSRPWVTLGKQRPDDIGDIRGGKTVREVNTDLAERVFERRNLDLPAQYVDLLPADMRREWRDRNE